MARKNTLDIWKDILEEKEVENFMSKEFPDEVNKELNRAYELHESLKDTLINIKLMLFEEADNNKEWEAGLKKKEE